MCGPVILQKHQAKQAKQNMLKLEECEVKGFCRPPHNCAVVLVLVRCAGLVISGLLCNIAGFVVDDGLRWSGAEVDDDGFVRRA